MKPFIIFCYIAIFRILTEQSCSNLKHQKAKLVQAKSPLTACNQRCKLCLGHQVNVLLYVL